jgi:hypothetical protein
MRRAIRLPGTYRNASGIATVLICVVNAILYVALDALDVLAAVRAASAKLTIFHNLFLSFLLCDSATFHRAPFAL